MAETSMALPNGAMTNQTGAAVQEAATEGVAMTTQTKVLIGVAAVAVITLIGYGIYAFSQPPRRRRYARENPHRGKHRCRTGSNVQSLLFPRSHYSPASAKAWARHHGYRASHAKVERDYIHIPQHSDRGYTRIRTISFKNSGGIKAHIGWKRC